MKCTVRVAEKQIPHPKNKFGRTQRKRVGWIVDQSFGCTVILYPIPDSPISVDSVLFEARESESCGSSTLHEPIVTPV